MDKKVKTTKKKKTKIKPVEIVTRPPDFDPYKHEGFWRDHRALPYKYVLFDLDGTLAYTHWGIFSSIRYALRECGYEKPSDEQLRDCIGPPLAYTFSVTFGASPEMTRMLIKRYRERYAVIGWAECDPIPDADKMLQLLIDAGYILAVATSKPQIFAEKVLDKFGIKPFFKVICGSDLDGHRETKADVIAETLRLLGATGGESVMVGDRKYDAEGARALGLDFVGMDIGYAVKGELRSVVHKYLFTDYHNFCRKFVRFYY